MEGYNVELRVWLHLLMHGSSFSVSTVFRENICKILHQWHLSPMRVAGIYRISNDHCWLCGQLNANLLQIW